MTQLRVAEAAELLGVSDDTVRRWIDSGKLAASKDGPAISIDGADLAALAVSTAHPPVAGPAAGASARNRMKGLVTRVVKDTVMAQVEIQAGPFRIVSLISREAVDELGLEPGSVAIASVKSTNVTVEVGA